MPKIWPTVLFVPLILITVLSSAENTYAAIKRTLEVRVSHGNDDCEEDDGGKMYLTSTDLELINDSGDQTVGLRFQNVGVPRGATITGAYLQFHVDEVSTDGCRLTIRGQAAGDAAAFTVNSHDLSSRPMTTVSETWEPPAWELIGESGPDQRTPDISGVIQEIVSRDDWSSGNAMVIIITGTGTRTAASYVGAGAEAALLHIEYTVPVFVSPSADPSAVMVERRIRVRVSQDNDDCEEDDGGKMYLASTDLELVNDGGDQTVGLRFQNVGVPRGATITSAYVQFYVDEVSTGGCALTIRGQAAADATVFTANLHDLSSRPMTTVSETWEPPAWELIGESGPDQRTPDISGVIQEIVNREDWNSGNAMVIIITGTGARTAASYGGTGARAALLNIEYAAWVSNPVRVESPSPSVLDALAGVMRSRNLVLEFGVYAFNLNYAADDSTAVVSRREGDLGFSSAYGLIRYVTNPWHGFRLGAGAVVVADFYQTNQAGQAVDRDRYYLPRIQFYEQNSQLFEAFLQYGISKSYIKVGRQRMNSIRFGYEAAEGISLGVNELNRVSFLFESFWRGLEDAGYDEITTWGTVREHEGRRGEAASDAVFSAQARITTPGRWLRLTPYYLVQKDFMNAFGARAEFRFRRGAVRYGLTLGAIDVNEATPFVEYDADWYAFVTTPRVEFAGTRVEVGYHKMGPVETGAVPAWAYWMNNLNPRQNGRRVLQSSTETYFARLSYQWRRVDARIRYANSESPFGYDSDEWGLRLRYHLTRHIRAELDYLYYNDQLLEDDFTRVEALLRFRF